MLLLGEDAGEFERLNVPWLSVTDILADLPPVQPGPAGPAGPADPPGPAGDSFSSFVVGSSAEPPPGYVYTGDSFIESDPNAWTRKSSTAPE